MEHQDDNMTVLEDTRRAKEDCHEYRGGSKGCDQLRDMSNHVRVKPGKWTGEGTDVDGTR